MALKDILVHVDSSNQSRVRLDAAISLASTHEAHLIAVYVLTQPRIPGYVRAQITEDVL